MSHLRSSGGTSFEKNSLSFFVTLIFPAVALLKKIMSHLRSSSGTSFEKNSLWLDLLLCFRVLLRSKCQHYLTPRRACKKIVLLQNVEKYCFGQKSGQKRKPFTEELETKVVVNLSIVAYTQIRDFVRFSSRGPSNRTLWNLFLIRSIAALSKEY